MTFQEKNVTVSLVIFSSILIYLVGRTMEMMSADSFTEENVFWMWGLVIGMVIIGMIVGMILSHAGSVVLEVIRTGNEEPEIDELVDERDKLIDLKGTNVMHKVSSIASFFAMLTYAFGWSPLIMFTLLIFSGIVAQIAGDVTRLWLYRQG